MCAQAGKMGRRLGFGLIWLFMVHRGSRQRAYEWVVGCTCMLLRAMAAPGLHIALST